MSALDNVIGYKKVKEDLRQIIDIFKNPDLYKEMGAKLPHGVLLYGEPGMGKTLLATSLIEEIGVKTFEVINNKDVDAVKTDIKEAFDNAAKEAPAIVFFDDLDKFSSRSEEEVDDPLFVTIQSSIDKVKDKDVLVIATANHIEKLPSSLKRNGRFDRKLIISDPGQKDAEKIVEYYLRKRKVDPNANYDDIAKMISYTSCADLDKIVNEGAILATYKRKKCVETSDIVDAYLEEYYGVSDAVIRAEDDEKSIALHEAGHAVVAEALKKGCVGLISTRTSSGFTKLWSYLRRRPQCVLFSLGGKVACELYDKGRVASGCRSDLEGAVSYIEEGLSGSGALGVSHLCGTNGPNYSSDSYRMKLESAIHDELERYLFLARDILIKNKDFLFALRDELLAKGTLLHSDIARIRDRFELFPCPGYTELPGEIDPEDGPSNETDFPSSCSPEEER